MKCRGKHVVAMLCLGLMLLPGRPGYAAEKGAGLAAGDFLNIIPDPRAAALGGGSVALIANTPLSAVSNPASLCGITRPWVSFSYITLIEDVNYNYGSFAVPTAIGTLGGSLGYLSYGTIDGYNNDLTPKNITASHDLAAVFSYSLPIRTSVPLTEEHGAVGLNIKFLQNKLVDYSVEAIAADFGAIYRIPFVEGLNVGATYRNFGSNLKFVNNSNPLPVTLDLGMSYSNPAVKNIGITFDYHQPEKGPSYYSCGLSASPFYSVDLRAGWVENADSPFTGFRAGIGLDFGDVNVNYSFTPARYFSPLHHIAVNVAVGEIKQLGAANDYYLEQHFHKACEYYYRKDYIEARQRFEEILSLYPTHHSSQKFLEKIAVGIDKMEQKKADDIRKLLAKGDVATVQRDYLTASACYNKILAIEPDQEEARVGLDQVAQLVAQVKLEKTKQRNREYIERLWKSGLKLYQKGDFVKSKDQFNTILEIDPENEGAKKYVVEIDNQLTKIAASQIDSLYSNACALYRRERYEEAVKYFEAVTLAAPHRLDAQDFAVQCQVKIRERKEKARADEIARQQGEMKGEMSSVFEKGLKAYEKGAFEEALKQFTKSAELADKYYFKEYADNSQNYLNMIKIALSEQHYKTGFEYFRRNRTEAAAREYRKALQYNPENTSARVELDRIGQDLAQHYYQEGMACFSRGENEKAREMFQESLTYQPDKAESLRALERLR